MSKRVAVCPGTFDPITNGHIDIVERSLRLFDEVVVAILQNPKKTPLFSLEERVRMAEESLKGFKGVRVDTFSGLLMDYARKIGAVAVVRGLRAVSDFEYEMQMALMNRRLDSEIETVFMMPSEEYTFLSSTMIKEIAFFGGPVKGLVPPVVEEALRRVFSKP
ncbi:MAG: pantetheine-phosphate adenylyltransferase [Nitrospirae bacterium]|nr:MAG: pantetheine-phosphate adenylyltransferase [Nitrospirota bacterium]